MDTLESAITGPLSWAAWPYGQSLGKCERPREGLRHPRHSTRPEKGFPTAPPDKAGEFPLNGIGYGAKTNPALTRFPYGIITRKSKDVSKKRLKSHKSASG